MKALRIISTAVGLLVFVGIVVSIYSSSSFDNAKEIKFNEFHNTSIYNDVKAIGDKSLECSEKGYSTKDCQGILELEMNTVELFEQVQKQYIFCLEQKSKEECLKIAENYYSMKKGSFSN